MTGSQLPWPHGKRACICLTMDNMGEAADIHRGLWPKDKPVGDHYSVKSALPKMLELLEEKQIPATYFIEAWNFGVYPDTIQDLQKRGIEVGYHAFQHEVWGDLDEMTEVGNLDKSVRMAKEIGVAYKGFRPPGGKITPRTLTLMKERGITYLSPAAERPAVVEGAPVLPFEWKYIDAYYYLDSTAALRQLRGDSKEKISPAGYQAALLARIDEVIDQGGFLALLFHPFLTETEERLAVMETVLNRLLTHKTEIWMAKHHEVAEWVSKHADAFGSEPGWDTAVWKRK